MDNLLHLILFSKLNVIDALIANLNTNEFILFARYELILSMVIIVLGLGVFYIIIGLLVILLKLRNTADISGIFGLRLKMVVFPSLIFIAYLSLLAILNGALFDIKFPILLQYASLILLIGALILEYWISTRLYRPIKNLFQGIENFKPDQQPTPIPVISKDELGIATEQFNKKTELVWESQEQLKESRDQEKTLRNLISAIGKSLDVKEVLDVICFEVTKAFNGHAAAILLAPPDISEVYMALNQGKTPAEIFFGSIFSRYDKDPDWEISARKMFSDPRWVIYWLEACFIPGKTIAFDDISKADAPDYVKNSYKGLFKSLITVNIKRENDNLGILSIVSVKSRHWRQEEINLLELIADQAYLVIKQAQLYTATRKQAEKERILKEIVSEAKISSDIEEIFSRILPKMADIYNTDRTFYIELAKFKHERPVIKSEYLRSKELLSLKDKELPEICINTFTESMANLESVVINDVQNYHSDNIELQNFFNTNRIKSLLMIPLVKHDKNIQALGIISICSQVPRIWTQDEINLLRSITDPVINVITEIQNRNEIDQLRNTFILTLAHDLQVPLVGERKALEFLSIKPETAKYKELIDEIIENNKSIYNLLSRLIHSYNYESGKQRLRLTKNNLGTLLNDVININREWANSKSIQLDIEIERDLPEISIDKHEINNAICNLVTNAINYTQEGGRVWVKAYKRDNQIITSISDNGPGISPDVRERIFERYAMAQAIERKVASGLGLYLVKQIIEAHKGKIWYITELGKGTTFCISLPIT